MSARGFPSFALTFILSGSLTLLALLLGKGPRPFSANDQVSWVGLLHTHSFALPPGHSNPSPSVQDCPPTCPCAWSLLEAGPLISGEQSSLLGSAPPASIMGATQHYLCFSFLPPCSSPFWIWARSGAASYMSGCLFRNGSPPFLLLPSFCPPLNLSGHHNAQAPCLSCPLISSSQGLDIG